jgi:hypothetical protein
MRSNGSEPVTALACYRNLPGSELQVPFRHGTGVSGGSMRMSAASA